MGAARTAAIRTPRRRSIAAVLAMALGLTTAPPAIAQAMAPAPSPPVGTIADFIDKASQRVGMPAAWIAAVMRAESAFDPRATSPKGAMGLMQLMPDTWAALRAQLALGPDPYDPRDNILAGAWYLRDLYDQFGVGGFLAAYNAGPGRYLDFLTGKRPLPAETRAYVASISTAINGDAAVAPPLRVPAAVVPPRPGLFVALTAGHNDAGASAVASDQTPAGATPGALFVGEWDETR